MRRPSAIINRGAATPALTPDRRRSVTDSKSVLVIGSGAAGNGAARSLARSGWDVTVADGDRIGGTCLWRGCMPKKSLARSASVHRTVLSAEQYGSGPCDPQTDWQTVLAWKWHSQETYAGDQEKILSDLGIRLLKSTARFVSPEQVDVGGELLSPTHTVIATGSTPIKPPVRGIELADTSDDALGYHELPGSLLIVGGGFIGLEFAGMFASFGTAVTVVSSGPRPLEMLDEDVASVAVRRLERMGVTFFSDCRMQGLLEDPEGIRTTFLEKPTNMTHEGVYQRVLVATGRKPALASLDVAAAGIALDDRGRLVLDSSLATTNPRVWAGGDAAGGMMQTPVASYEGRCIAASIDTGAPVVPEYGSVPTCVFTVPNIAQVGLNEADARSQGIAYRVGNTPFEYLGAAIIDDERDGLVKLIFAEEDGRLIGAHIVGPTASDLIYGLAVAMKCGATASTIRDTLGIHPAYCESVNWAAW